MSNPIVLKAWMEIFYFTPPEVSQIELYFVLDKATFGNIDKPESKFQVQAQSQIEKGKRNLDPGLSLKSYGPPPTQLPTTPPTTFKHEGGL